MRLPIGSHVEWFDEFRDRLMTGMIVAYDRSGMLVEIDDSTRHILTLPPGFLFRDPTVKIGLERRRECAKWAEGRS